MFIPMPKRLALTFIFALTVVFALVAVSEAKGYDTPLRRDHGIKRLIRKRAPQNLAAVNPTIVASPNPPADNPPPASPSAPAANPTTPTVVAPQPSDPVVSASPPPPTTSDRPLSTPVAVVNSIINPVTSVPTVAPSVASVPPTASTPPATTAPLVVASSSSSTPQPISTSTAPLVVPSSSKKPSSPNIVTLTSEVSAASATATGVPAKNAQMQKTATTVLIVIASVVGGTAIIWTIIRKWKFSPSNSFEDRMQPIDWQPTNEESGLPARRLSNASSFHSAGHGENMAGYGVGGGYGSTSDYGHGGYGSSDLGHGVAPGVAPLQPIPDHDFTAAPSTNLAPVGGYADLSRGPSPGPQMQEAYHGPVGYQSYNGSQDAYDYNGGTRY